MATPAELDTSGILVKIDVDFDIGENPERLIYAFPSVIEWLSTTLPTLQSDGYIPGALTPLQQVENFFHDFIVGKEIKEFPPHVMKPEAGSIWELRTADIRFFGWFWRAGIFVAGAVDEKARCEKHNLYFGYREQTLRQRSQLDLDDPKFVSGNISDVL